MRLSLSVTVNFRPTESPPRPIMPDANLLSSIKSAPEEWYQILCKVGQQLELKNVHSSVSIVSSTLIVADEIWSQLFIPSALIYGLSDTILFHLQISGPTAILRELVRPPPRPKSQDPVHVYLMRRISLFVRGDRQRRDIEIGQGVLSMLPPPISSMEFNSQNAVLDWAGEIQCDDSITAGTFDVGTVYVKVGGLFYFLWIATSHLTGLHRGLNPRLEC